MLGDGSFAWSCVTNRYEYWPGVDQQTADELQKEADLEGGIAPPDSAD